MNKRSVDDQPIKLSKKSVRSPLYMEVAATIQQEIEQGKYAVGSTLPTEEALSERFNVSRHTIRQALRELKAEGQILSRAGIGTIVRTQPEKIWIMSGLNTLADLLEFATETEMQIMSRTPVVTDRKLAKQLKCEVGSKWLKLDVLRVIPNQPRPLSLLNVYVNPLYVGKLQKIKHLKEPIYSLLEREFDVRITEVYQEVTADSLDHEVAELLDATPGQSALRITRHFYDRKGGIVQIVVGFYPSGRYTQVTRLQSKNEQP